MPSEPFEQLRAQLGSGDVAAAEALFRVYTPYLRAVVRRQLSDRLRPRFDSTDVVQSVWVQVVRQLGRDGWRVETEEQLRGLLATIARRRLVSRVRKHTGEMDDERPPAAAWDAVPQGRYDRPSEAAQADDVWDELLKACPPEHHQVLWLRRDGLQLADIAARTGLHEGSVRRILRRVARAMALRRQPLPADLDPGPGE